MNLKTQLEDWVFCAVYRTCLDKSLKKRVQFNHCNSIKNKLGRNDILVHVDYSGGYENKHQHEILSAYFGHMSFSIFTTCCYFRDSEDNLMSKSITTTIELPNHSRTSAITCASKVREKYQENVTEKYQYLPLWINAFVWRDGCGAQFRSRYVFTLLSTFDISVNLTWHYNERHHSKGPMDGIDGT